MSLDFRRGDIEFAATDDVYEATSTFQQPIHQRKSRLYPQHSRASAKRMVLIKPKAQVKTWILEAEATPLPAILKRLIQDMSKKYGHLSNLEPLLFSEEYMAVIGLGPRVVPLLLSDMKSGNTPWFWALKAITRENVGASVGAGNFRNLRDAWLAWGVEKGLI